LGNAASWKFAKLQLVIVTLLKLDGARNLQYVKISKRPNGSLNDSCQKDGLLLEYIGQPQQSEKYRILFAIMSMNADKIEICADIGLAKKKMESHYLIAQVVASTAFQTSIIATDDIIEEGKGGNINIHSKPDNTNLTYPEVLEVECEAWDVQEFEQLLQEQDKLQRDEQDHKVYFHRRAMTDKEQLQEDQGLDWLAGTKIVEK
jgi:hypothetical protein